MNELWYLTRITLYLGVCLATPFIAHSFYIDKTRSGQPRPVPQSTLCSSDHFQHHFTQRPPSFTGNNFSIKTNLEALLEVVQDTLSFIDKRWPTDRNILDPHAFASTHFPFSRVTETLHYLESILKHDLKHGGNRLNSPAFLQKYFSFIKWHPDTPSCQKTGIALKKDHLRRTFYVIYQAEGSYHKTAVHNHPLYMLKHGHHVPPLTKQEIFRGALENPSYAKHVKPMVWLSQEGVEDALLQGTIIVKMPDGKQRIFSTDQHNGFEYERPLSPLSRQKRYWFFKEPPHRKTTKMLSKFHQRAGVVIAGDIENIGLGKLVALSHLNPQTGSRDMQLCVLADTGGAFKSNLCQIDLFGGVFSSKKEVRDYMKAVPEYVEAYIMVKKT